MGMVVQHNLPAINAHRQMGINSNSLSKSLEKLSSGFAINRAADNAAGLAISEKMRGQINGLNQASKNAQDGISLIQTAEGALNETHSILQRMRELSVQSANGTYQDEVDRENISKEVEALKSEIDRISTSTHYNNIKLLDGSLSSTGANGTSYGAKFGIEVAANAPNAGGFIGASVTSNVKDTEIKTVADGATKGGENASWSEDGLTLTLNLAKDTTYTQAQIDDLIKNADVSKVASGNPADVSIKLNNGIFVNGNTDASTGKTVAGVRSGSTATNIGSMTAKGNYADQITITSNNYGVAHDKTFNIVVNAEAGKESVTTKEAYVSDAKQITVAKGAAGGGNATLDVTVAYKDNQGTAAAKVNIAAAATANAEKAGTVEAVFDGVNGDINITLYTKESGADNAKVDTTTTFSEDDINRAISKLLTEKGSDTTATQNKLGIESFSVSGSITIDAGTAVADAKMAAAIAASDVPNTITNPIESNVINLASGVEYTEQDIKNILKKAGLDYDVKLSDVMNYDGSNTIKFDVKNTNGISVSTTGGAGVGAEDGATNTGEGLVFQIGANGSADQRVALNVDDMSSTGIGIKAISVGTRENANAAIDVIDKAINQVSGTRADLGALQNRLEHTINSLDVASENLTASESRIRDVDMAKEMMQFSKSQILSQASQAMLAQANTLPQGVLQLLQ